MTNNNQRPASKFYKERRAGEGSNWCTHIRVVVAGEYVECSYKPGTYDYQPAYLGHVDTIAEQAIENGQSCTIELHYRDGDIAVWSVTQKIKPPTINMYTAPMQALQFYGTFLSENFIREKLENDQLHFMATLDEMESNPKWLRYNSKRYKKCLAILDKVTCILEGREYNPN